MSLMENNNDLINDIDDVVITESEDDNKEIETSQREHHHSHQRHHRHHSSSHRHHHRHKSRKKNDKKLKFKNALAIIISLCILLSMFAFAVVKLELDKMKLLANQSVELTSDILTVDVENSEGEIVVDAVNQYLLTDMLNPENASITPKSFAGKGDRIDIQIPVTLKFSVKEGNAIFYKLEIATDVAFSNIETVFVEADKSLYQFKYLYANTTYYYRVTVYMQEGTKTVTGQFKTVDTPRILNVDGIYNVRDIGNWKTESGKRIKQGLLLRGTELDGAVENTYRLTSKGFNDMINELNIKTEMDLRAKTDNTKDALGISVKHNYYSMVFYDEIFTDKGKETVRNIFADLANKDNYPIYLHCTHGCDRTGTVCYLLEALLGVSREDCLKEYGLSNLTVESIIKVENGLKAYGGETLSQQTESYLLSCGISKYEIDCIRNIFLGE